MQDDIVRILSPLLVVAAMVATEATRLPIRDMLAAGMTRAGTQPSTATSCHGTHLGNSLPSACASAHTPPQTKL